MTEGQALSQFRQGRGDKNISVCYEARAAGSGKYLLFLRSLLTWFQILEQLV